MDEQTSSHNDSTTPRSTEARVLRGAFSIAGFAANTAWRSSQMMAGAIADVTRQVVQSAMEGDSSAEFGAIVTSRMRSLARSALGVTEDSLREIAGILQPSAQPPNPKALESAVSSADSDELRRRGGELLAKSADVYVSDDLHPAFDRVLGDIAPDEARMLIFLATNGPQPVVDVRTNRPLGIGSELVSDDLNSVAEQAGCRRRERARSYLINLGRLGLLEICDDPVELSRYMVLEVQPSVEAALLTAGRLPKILRKSIHLTDFGAEFCATCFDAQPKPPASS